MAETDSPATIDPLPSEEIRNYGVDWDTLENDATLLRHYNLHNPDAIEEDWTEAEAQEQTHLPPHLSNIEVPAFACPLLPEELDMLHDHLL
jgi:hypothetical protein